LIPVVYDDEKEDDCHSSVQEGSVNLRMIIIYNNTPLHTIFIFIVTVFENGSHLYPTIVQVSFVYEKTAILSVTQNPEKGD
jgi:hypothetical protein